MTKNSSELGHYKVAICSAAVYIQVVGQGNMNNCGPLQDFVRQQIEQGIQEFYFDLKSCKGFDSTFMGLLVGFRSNASSTDDSFDDWDDDFSESQSDLSSSSMRIYMINTDSAHRKLLEEVGIDNVVEISENQHPCPEVINLTKLNPTSSTAQQHLKRVVQAHRNLIQANKKNEKTFGSFLKMIKQELQKE